jgi:uncharacterized protein
MHIAPLINDKTGLPFTGPDIRQLPLAVLWWWGMAENGTRLRGAAGRNDLPLVNALLRGPNPTPVDDKHEKTRLTALMLASQGGHSKMVEALLDRGADVNAQDAQGQTGLIMAAMRGHKQVAEVLLARGADIEAATSAGFTALMEAARWGKKDVVQLLLSNGASTTRRDRAGKTAEDLAKDTKVKALIKVRSSRKVSQARSDSHR